MLVPRLAEAGFVLIMAAMVPVFAYRTSRNPEILALPRIKLYQSAVISQWLLAALGITVFFLTSIKFAEVGIRPVSPSVLLLWITVLTLISLPALDLVVWLERKGRWPPEPSLVHALIPRTRAEKIWAVLLIAPTAAICEEFLYRGFLLAVLSQWSDSPAWGCLLSSAAFGMAHFYQGLGGIARAALLGVLLALPVIRLGSIFPSMAAHFLIDAVALLWLGPKMVSERG